MWLAARQQGRSFARPTWPGWIELDGAAWSPPNNTVRGSSRDAQDERELVPTWCHLAKIFQRACLFPGERAKPVAVSSHLGVPALGRPFFPQDEPSVAAVLSYKGSPAQTTTTHIACPAPKPQPHLTRSVHCHCRCVHCRHAQSAIRHCYTLHWLVLRPCANDRFWHLHLNLT